MVAQVRRDGQIREVELVIGRAGEPARHVTARVAPLGSRLVLALVEDRTRERRIEEVRRDFVANVSHELKTPVGAIRLLAEAVAEASDDPEAVKRFAEPDAHREPTGCAGWSSRSSSCPGCRPTTRWRRRAGVASTTCSAFAVDSSADRRRARSTSRSSPSGTPGLEVLGNEKQVTAAVANLVANAVSYSARGLDGAGVAPRPVDGDVEVSVVDQGIGIPHGEIDRIFERFYRVDPARHRSTGGTGLGLSIVKHVAATHGGEVRVWSVEGQGSTFTLTLPQHLSDGDVSLDEIDRAGTQDRRRRS